MEITDVLDSYLGKQTQVALKELPKIACELGYYFDCRCATFGGYSNDYSHIVGYVINYEKRSVTLYNGFMKKFCEFIKFQLGYLKYNDLVLFNRTLEPSLNNLNKTSNNLKVKILGEYLDYLKEL